MGDKMTKIQSILFSHQDKEYGDFIAKLVPTLPREKFIGVRSPEYKKILQELKDIDPEEIDNFTKSLPHKYHEENALHIILISKCKDYDQCIHMLEDFLPYIDNWAISDSLDSKTFPKNKDKLIKKVREWITSDEPYTKRVAMIILKKHFLDEDFKEEYLELAAAIRSDEYYVNMMTAWLFADALIKQWDTAIRFLQEHKLDKCTHNKTIQKARESYRVTSQQKEYLKQLRQ